jgi:hypothetical protein
VIVSTGNLPHDFVAAWLPGRDGTVGVLSLG